MIDKGMKDGELMTGNCSYHDVVCWHRIVQSYWIGRTFFSLFVTAQIYSFLSILIYDIPPSLHTQCI